VLDRRLALSTREKAGVALWALARSALPNRRGGGR
jgi:hypothetical protein